MKPILTTLALLAAPLASPVGFAQSDGTLGSSSTGTLNFNVNISDANRVQILDFADMVQTIETGQGSIKGRGNGPFAFQGGTGIPGAPVALPCIIADLPDTTVTLDWSVTPLTDGSNTVPFIFSLSHSVDSPGSTEVAFLRDVITTQSGSVSGVPARPASSISPGNEACRLRNSLPGRLKFTYTHSVGQTVETPGIYVSTTTFTVKPE